MATSAPAERVAHTRVCTWPSPDVPHIACDHVCEEANRIVTVEEGLQSLGRQRAPETRRMDMLECCWEGTFRPGPDIIVVGAGERARRRLPACNLCRTPFWGIVIAVTICLSQSNSSEGEVWSISYGKSDLH